MVTSKVTKEVVINSEIDPIKSNLQAILDTDNSPKSELGNKINLDDSKSDSNDSKEYQKIEYVKIGENVVS